MVTLVENIITGVWGDDGTPMPEEWIDFSLMRTMGWTWQEISGSATPRIPNYVKIYTAQFMNLINQEAEARARHNQMDATPL